MSAKMLPMACHFLFKTNINMKLGRMFFTKNFLNKASNFPLLFNRKNLYLFTQCYNSVHVQEKYISENTFARRILESSPDYKDFIIKELAARKDVNDTIDPEEVLQQTNFENISVEELCTLLKKLSYSPRITISHPSCDKLRLTLKGCCNDMTDEQVLSVLGNLSYWPLCDSPREQNFFELWNELDKVCLSRWKQWDVDKIFLFLDSWYGLHLLKHSQFVYKVVGKLTSKPHNLSPQKVVLLLFYLNILRGVTKNLSMYELEHRLAECANELTLDEIGIAMMGFFKGNKSLCNEKLMTCLVDKIISDHKSASDITFTSTIKILRKSLPISLWPRVEQIFDAITEDISHRSVQSCAHVGLLATRPQFLHEPLLRGVSQKLVDNIAKCRLKDMEKVVFPLVQLAYDPLTKPCIFNAILEELEKPERIEECDMYPTSFIALIHYFCVKGLYAEKFISKILDPQFIHKAYGPKKFYYGRELLNIDTIVELDLPSYTGPRLPTDIQNYLAKKYAEYLPDPTRKLSRHQKWLYDIIQSAEILFGKEYIASKYLLPNHPRADIVVHLDENMNPLPLSDSFKNSEHFSGVLRAPGKNYYALVSGSVNMHLYNKKQLNGESLSKLKTLKLIGYNPVLVPYFDWPSNSTFEKTQYLKNLISNSGFQ